VAADAKLRSLKFHPALSSKGLMIKVTSGCRKNPHRTFHAACAFANAKAEPVIEYK
jgi:hypothetical protein